MNYEKITVERPSDVYDSSLATKQRIEDILHRYEVIAFRPCKIGEQIIAKSGIVLTAAGLAGETLFIIQPREPIQRIEDVWE